MWVKKQESLIETTIQPMSLTTADLVHVEHYAVSYSWSAGCRHNCIIVFTIFLKERKKLELQKSEEKFWKNIK